MVNVGTTAFRFQRRIPILGSLLRPHSMMAVVRRSNGSPFAPGQVAPFVNRSTSGNHKRRICGLVMRVALGFVGQVVVAKQRTPGSQQHRPYNGSTSWPRRWPSLRRPSRFSRPHRGCGFWGTSLFANGMVGLAGSIGSQPGFLIESIRNASTTLKQ